ncbi:hypothetical protein SARI_04493 [Salmonella enterica subsp. arizonae serovar 62:z4,z23:-]|uniref:Uncharacterized protein n=1 Tax=Salmonella arizonae (strain ATCC BAA-731 / CDC346-86 / RSK2980) TaxID=41514 RepID=A9MQM2_SALAR|nr:hypothetical protein SARI_04493 [Salmonella enterica subsp. arizonae serovar 62:z4,z23:-]
MVNVFYPAKIDTDQINKIGRPYMVIFVIWLSNSDSKVDMRNVLVEFRSQNGFYRAHFAVG